MNNLTPISQSTITAMIDYQAGKACGLQIKARLDGVEFPSSDAQRLGAYFEWKATGQADYYGNIPEPEYLQSPTPEAKERTARIREWITERKKGRGKKAAGIGILADKWRAMLDQYEDNHPAMAEAYRRADQQAENFKAYIKAHGWEILESGKRYEVDGMTALVDANIGVLRNGYWPKDWGKREPDFIMDLKYSAGLDTRFGEYAWSAIPEYPKPKITIQAIQYNAVTGKQFMWALFSSKPDLKARFIPAVITENAYNHHMQTVTTTRNMIDANNLTGWRAIPSFTRCRECPLFDGCEHKHEIPMPETGLIIE